MLLVLVVGLVAGVIGGVVGFGSSILLLPVLVLAYGPRIAVPIMAVASVLANLARVATWWREIDWRACGAYAITGIPAAALGARTLLILPPRAAEVALGIFFIGMIPARRWLFSRGWRAGLPQLALAGALIGFLSGIVVSTGPVSVPIFLAYGLAKGAFIATEAAASLALDASKSLVFRGSGALPLEVLTQGLIAGGALMVGTFAAKPLVLRIPAERFRLLMDGIMLLSGATMLAGALGK